MTVIATIRADEFNFPLLVHVLGAMLLVGALVLSATVLILSSREGTPTLARLGFRSLLLGVLPAWVMMRAGGQWTASKEGLENADLAWLDVGFMTGDAGLPLILIALLLAGLAMRRVSRSSKPGGLGASSAVIACLLLLAYVVTIWAMSAKPT